MVDVDSTCSVVMLIGILITTISPKNFQCFCYYSTYTFKFPCLFITSLHAQDIFQFFFCELTDINYF